MIYLNHDSPTAGSCLLCNEPWANSLTNRANVDFSRKALSQEVYYINVQASHGQLSRSEQQLIVTINVNEIFRLLSYFL